MKSQSYSRRHFFPIGRRAIGEEEAANPSKMTQTEASCMASEDDVGKIGRHLGFQKNQVFLLKF